MLAVDPPAQEVHATDGGKPVARFILRNAGDAPLRITDVVPGCACALAELSATTLNPGETASLAVEVTPASIGSRSITTTIKTNCRRSPATDVQITCWPADNRPRIVGVAPDRLTLDGTVRNVYEPRLVSVTSLERSGKRMVSSMTCDLPFVRIKPGVVHERTLPSGAHVERLYRFHVSIEKEHPCGRFAGWLAIGADSDLAPTPEPLRRVGVEATLPSPVYAEPASLFAVARDDEDPPRWTVDVFTRVDATVEMATPECDVDWLAASWVSAPASFNSSTRLGQLEVTVTDLPPALPAEGTVIARTGLSDSPEIRVGVFLAGP